MYRGIPIRYHILYFIFWLFTFMVARVVFIALNFGKLSDRAPFFQYLKTEWHGISLDMSAAAYITFVPLLLSILAPLIRIDSSKIHKYYTLLMLVVITALIAVDARLYGYWGFRLDATPLFYLRTPGIVLGSLSFKDYLISIVLFGGLFTFYWYLYLRIFRPLVPKRNAYSVVLQLVLMVLLFLPMRGGLDVAPINLGRAYFSENTFLNHAAVNPVWNFLFSLTESASLGELEHGMGRSEALKFKENFCGESTEPSVFLNRERPDVLLIVLESFTSKLIGMEKDGKRVVPELEKLMEEGIYFSHFYASGDRTDKGLVSVLSGYPAQPTTSIMKYASKTRSLPNLFHVFREQGYYTEFLYGGDIDFASMRSYIRESGAESVIDKDDFPAETYGAKWGTYDHIVFDTLSNRLKRMERPYFTTMLSLSSHEPFDVPGEPVFFGSSQEDKMLNAANYTDRSLGEFIMKLKDSPAWDDLLVIVTADHGHRLPGGSSLEDADRFRIPMVWLGGAIDVNKEITELGSQTDLAATLLAQFGWDSEEFEFSRDMLSCSRPFAYYAFNQGYSVMSESTHWAFQNRLADPRLLKGEEDPELLDLGQRFYESVIYDFESR